MLEKTLESPLDFKIKPVHPKGNQSWIFIGKTYAEAEAPILWLPDVKGRLSRKDPGVGKYWRQEEKGMIGNEMIGWHHQLNGHEFEQALRNGEGQGRLACCSQWGDKESDITEQLNQQLQQSSGTKTAYSNVEQTSFTSWAKPSNSLITIWLLCPQRADLTHVFSFSG